MYINLIASRIVFTFLLHLPPKKEGYLLPTFGKKAAYYSDCFLTFNQRAEAAAFCRETS